MSKGSWLAVASAAWLALAVAAPQAEAGEAKPARVTGVDGPDAAWTGPDGRTRPLAANDLLPAGARVTVGAGTEVRLVMEVDGLIFPKRVRGASYEIPADIAYQKGGRKQEVGGGYRAGQHEVNPVSLPGRMAVTRFPFTLDGSGLPAGRRPVAAALFAGAKLLEERKGTGPTVALGAGEALPGTYRWEMTLEDGSRLAGLVRLMPPGEVAGVRERLNGLPRPDAYLPILEHAAVLLEAGLDRDAAILLRDGLRLVRPGDPDLIRWLAEAQDRLGQPEDRP